MLSDLPPYQGFEADVARAMEAFEHDPDARRLFKQLKSGRREFVPTELLVETVLRYLGENRRSWRDWSDPVMAAMNQLAAEAKRK
jgi:hypothetical protein